MENGEKLKSCNLCGRPVNVYNNDSVEVRDVEIGGMLTNLAYHGKCWARKSDRYDERVRTERIANLTKTRKE